MSRRLPSLNALKAFEAAARHQSFTKAADELCVTQGAVSHQVKALETDLGLRLFRREHQRLVLTDGGQMYFGVVRNSLDSLAAGTERLLQEQNDAVLTVTTSPNFASKWLVDRLSRFSADHPEIDLRISASLRHVDFTRDDFDLAIRHGEGRWPGLHVTRLCEEELFPVCSPDLLKGKNALRRAAELRRLTLLHLDDKNDWVKWLDAAGLGRDAPVKGPVFNQASMVIDAAVDGQGVALARSALVSRNLVSGRLVRPFELALKVDYAYWIVCPTPNASLAKVSAFREWLLSEVADDATKLPAPAKLPVG
jgi:LysR family glycine cleavage system transcriptional activator